VINSFEAVGAAAGDIIDLTGIDANLLVGGDQAFAFIGVAAFSGPAQVRVMNVGTNTAVQINNNGGLAPDMEIQVNDGAATAANWVAADFAL
jgi:serralysin